MSDLQPFGYKTAWLAVRDRDQASVVEALGLSGGRVVDVREAFEASAAGATAVLPPLRGVEGQWTLVVGEDVEEPSAGRVATLSAMLGTQVQAFASHRVVEAHRWLVAERGRVRRHLDVLGESGELVAWTGRPTEVELSLGLPDAEMVADDQAFDVVLTVTEEHVMTVAGAWSINPMTLSGPAPGSAVLVDRLRPDPPGPAPSPAPPVRRPWARLFGR